VSGAPRGRERKFPDMKADGAGRNSTLKKKKNRRANKRRGLTRKALGWDQRMTDEGGAERRGGFGRIKDS